MTLKGDSKFKEKLTFGLENDMRNMADSHQSTRKSQKVSFEWVPFEHLFFELKRYRGVIFHKTKEGCNIWKGIVLSF